MKKVAPLRWCLFAICLQPNKKNGTIGAIYKRKNKTHLSLDASKIKKRTELFKMCILTASGDLTTGGYGTSARFGGGGGGVFAACFFN